MFGYAVNIQILDVSGLSNGENGTGWNGTQTFSPLITRLNRPVIEWLLPWLSDYRSGKQMVDYRPFDYRTGNRTTMVRTIRLPG